MRLRAAEPPAGHSTLSLPAWWALPGSPGWTPDAAFAGGQPWVAAALAAGGFELRDPFASAALPAPGIPEALAPLAWYDSAVVVVGEGAAWRGFGAGLVSAQGIVLPAASRRPRSVWTVVNGSNAIDRNGLYVSRGDNRSWLRGGAVAGRRGGFGDLDLEGDHLWTFGLGARRGRHVVEGAFAQRGLGERLRTDFGEAARGESGWGAWSWDDSTNHVVLRLSRGHDLRQLIAIEANAYLYEREAQSNLGEIEATTRRGAATYGVRLEAREGRVSTVRYDLDVREARRERSLWLAARAVRALGPGRLELQLGAGHHDAATRRAERLQAAPAASWRLERGGRSIRVFGERLVNPVWCDVSPGSPAFVQDTWAGGLELRDHGRAGRAALRVVAGSTGNRAFLYRYPIRAVTLATYWERDTSRYAFTLVTGDASTRWRALGFEVSGHLLARQGDTVQPRVDPAVGGLAAITTSFRLFAGDLPVRLRGQAAWVGPRHTDLRFGLDDRTLAGYATYSAAAELGLGDATFALRGDGLEGTRHEETWPDFTQPAVPVLAKDAGRTFRFEMIWPLFN